MKKTSFFYGSMTACTLAALISGCSIFPEPRQSSIEYYDLKPPKQLQCPPIDVEQFVSFSGERQRMLRRKRDISVESSDFNKWMQPPGALLTRYLRLTFRNHLETPIVNRDQCAILRGEVITFEINGKEAVLGIRYQLKYDRQTYSKTVLIKEKIEGRGPAAFAQAMSRAAERFAQMIAVESARITAKRK